MTSSQLNNKISAKQLVAPTYFAPAATTATAVAWRDMSLYANMLSQLVRAVGLHNITSFSLIANTKSDGSGTSVTIRSHAIPTQPTANLGDCLNLECTAQEVADLGYQNSVNLRYVAAVIALATSTDVLVVTDVLTGPRFADAGLTVDIVT